MYIFLMELQELLTRLCHHNSFIQKSGLAGLQELVTYHCEEILSLHLAELIEATARLTLDQENDVRKAALKLLSIVLTQVKYLKIVHVQSCIDMLLLEYSMHKV
jgi:hypothetical protein